jgi:D-alanyl-D-alanine dipeptidase
LVPVRDICPLIVVELRYASAANFTGEPVYPADTAYLQRETALKLAAANDELVERGLRIKVWDAYRPQSLHRLLWEKAGANRYFFADPQQGSIHSRGAAVDVTLVDARGQEVEMPSGFDDFSGRGHRQGEFSALARANLDLLTEVMVRHGFQYIEFEWWHFEDTHWWQYPLLDLPLE